MTKGFPIYFALRIKNSVFYVLNGSLIANFSCLDLRIVLYNLAEITGKDKEPHTKPKQHLSYQICDKYVSMSSGIE